MHNILLFEENQEKVPHLVFLLKLADINCTVARTAEEVINWLSADRLMVINFDLVVLNSLQGSGMDNMLLTELCEVVTVPVVCVKRQDVPPSIFLIHHVVTCHPDDLLDCVKQQLLSANTQLSKEIAQ
jgi:DNA-binding NtrC family response regulator